MSTPWRKRTTLPSVPKRLLARGRTNKEIAATLTISPKTDQHHVAHVYSKLGVESRAAAALFATESGLLSR